MLTAFLSRADVSRHLQALHLLRELRDAFTTRKQASWVQALSQPPSSDGHSVVVRQATFPGVPAWSVTVRTQSKQGFRSVLQLHDAESGQLLAMMDAAHLMSLRASLVSALATDVLARPEAKTVAVLGAGTAVSSALKALRLVRSIDQVWLHDVNLADNFELALRLQQTLSMAVRAVDTVQDAVTNADVVVLTGQVRLDRATLKPGAHVAVLAADAFDATPLDVGTLQSARRFCDVSPPSFSWGAPFEHELGAVLAGLSPGRTTEDEHTVFASVGPAHLDLLAAWHVFEGARRDETLTRINLEA